MDDRPDPSGAPISGPGSPWAPPPEGAAPAWAVQAPGYPVAPARGRPPRRPVPRAVTVAVWAMCLGAVASVAAGLFALGWYEEFRAGFLEDDPEMSPADARHGAAEAVVGALVSGLGVGGVWLWMALACRRGLNWARIMSTVLASLAVLGIAAVLVAAADEPVDDSGTSASAWIGGCVIACAIAAAVSLVCLWRRSASEFFVARDRGPAPPAPYGHLPYG